MEIIISDSSNCKEYSKDNNCERFWLEEGCIITENIVGTDCSCVNLVAVVEPRIYMLSIPAQKCRQKPTF